MPNNVPGNLHDDASVPCPEHALTPTPPPPPPPPPYEITNAAGECFILVVSEDCQHHGFTDVLDAGECGRFAAAVATGDFQALIQRTRDDLPNGCNAYTTVMNGGLDIITFWNDKPDPNTQGPLGNSGGANTKNLVCRCPLPPSPPAPPAPPAPPPPSPPPPPRPPPPRLYAGGGCAFYTDGAASNPGVRVKKSGDSGLSVSGSVNQPLIAVGSFGGPSTSSEWLTLVTDKGHDDAEENGAGVLFFQVTVDDSGRGASNSAVTNARCVELCDWWDKCVTYEYFKWDGGRPCGSNSPGGCEHAGAYMRCELWIYPSDASVYSASEEHVNDVWCGAAGNGPHSGGQAPQNWPDLDDPTLKLTQPWPPIQRLNTVACFMDLEHQNYPCTGCIDGDTEHTHTVMGCGTGGNDYAAHLLDVYFPAADISHLVIHNARMPNCYGTHCTYRLGHEGWEVWYLPTSAGDGAYVEGDHPNGYPYVAHWVKCFETDIPTENVEVLEVNCVASNVFAVRIVQKYWDSMNLNEVEVYGTALPQPDNCVLSGAAHPVTGHLCSPAPSGAGSTGDAFCRDTGHGGCPGAFCDGVGSGKCAQNTR